MISNSQPTCGTAQKGPQLQADLFDLIDEDRGGPLTTPRQDACVARSSPVFVFRPEDPRNGPSPHLLLTSASLLLTSCLPAPSATGPKVVSPTVALVLGFVAGLSSIMVASVVRFVFLLFCERAGLLFLCGFVFGAFQRGPHGFFDSGDGDGMRIYFRSLVSVLAADCFSSSFLR